MLDRLITNPETRYMFEASENTLKYIVVDEVHYFRGTKGANLSLLLKRFRTLFKQPLVQIGASGTLRQGGGYFPDSKYDSIEQFARLIFGHEAVAKNGFQLIEPVFPDEQRRQSEPLFATDDIEGDSFLSDLSKSDAEKLYEQLSGKSLAYSGGGIEKHPMYRFAMSSPFIASMRERLTRISERPATGACTFQEIVDLFRQLYREAYGQEPRNPKRVVEAYWSLINYLNHRCEEQKPPLPLILDYRLHLIMGNVGDSLMRCLLCKRYHDGRCHRCRHCGSGLLFKVSKAHPDLCIAYFTGKEIFPKAPLKRPKFEVLVQLLSVQVESTDTSVLRFSVEPNMDTSTDEESYLLRPTHQGEDGIAIHLSLNRQDMEALPLNEPRLYWHNVLKVTDALVVRPETKSSDKLLGFIDNRERASGIKLRLNDDIAERTLTAWAASIWSQMGEMNLEYAFHLLQRAISPATVNSPEEEEDAVNASLHEALREMPFWFSRMLADLNSYPGWEVYVDKSLVLHPDEDELLNEIMLSEAEAAIDRTSFWGGEPVSLKHFHVEKYRVDTHYGVALKSTDDRGYNITSLGEQGRLYKSFIARITSAGIKEMLGSLTERGILVQKKTPDGTSFYQLHPKYLMIKTSVASQLGEGTSEKWEEKFATVECHTADHNDELRSQIEARFSEGKIQALICTPTLEMGVDIGKLSSVLMIGFPPSPANYAQRAGRAGRSDKSHLATIVVLSSPEDAHDEYYYSSPQKMIDGAITPPQFTLTNFALLAAHVYAYLSSTKGLPILSNALKLEESLMEFIEHNELHLRDELGESYTSFERYLIEDGRLLAARLKSNGPASLDINACYRLGIFPDYGFRRDGLPLVRGGSTLEGNEDNEDFLTSREPEQAARKLVPGRIVFCGGKAVKVDENQPQETYKIQKDSTESDFRYYKYVVADERKDVQIERMHDPDTLYRLSRFLDVKKPLEELEKQGPAYLSVYFVRQGTLFFINEGEVRENGLHSLKDFKGDYRFGTSIERDGLLVCFADHILPPNLKTNFLAALLRGIPDYFDLDDSELRVVQNLSLYPQSEHEPGKRVSFFIYGHDESGLVPFEKIFRNFEKIIIKALDTLKTCSCRGEGCYLCLFSLNSRALSGRISYCGAMDCLSIYLRHSLLKPRIAPAKDVITQVDVILALSRSGDQYRVVAENTLARKRAEYTRENAEEDQNTRIYTALRVALEQEWESGSHTVKICCKENYICEQLRGENDVKNGREAFLNLWLTLLKWQYWVVEKV